MTKKPIAKRVERWRLAKKEAGLKEIRNLWIKPEHEARVRRAAELLGQGCTLEATKTNEGKT